ncbi:hypothetical protein ECC02_008970 [Trypanosoma cruzi]|uniref:Uncharacterized protein n=1 Tax=Trypanosoma cruzi TaxID=5693 RepID=A0A7J6XV36_TRYCR|nr:hypothetical protein ECC02_008970 [Trypanosoma cruzi]
MTWNKIPPVFRRHRYSGQFWRPVLQIHKPIQSWLRVVPVRQLKQVWSLLDRDQVRGLIPEKGQVEWPLRQGLRGTVRKIHEVRTKNHKEQVPGTVRYKIQVRKTRRGSKTRAVGNRHQAGRAIPEKGQIMDLLCQTVQIQQVWSLVQNRNQVGQVSQGAQVGPLTQCRKLGRSVRCRHKFRRKMHQLLRPPRQLLRQRRQPLRLQPLRRPPAHRHVFAKSTAASAALRGCVPRCCSPHPRWRAPLWAERERGLCVPALSHGDMCTSTVVRCIK